MDADLQVYLDTMQKALTQQMTQLNAETRKELGTQMVELNAETRRELGTPLEELHDQVKLLAEAVAINNDRLETLLTDHAKRITHLEERRG